MTSKKRCYVNHEIPSKIHAASPVRTHTALLRDVETLRSVFRRKKLPRLGRRRARACSRAASGSDGEFLVGFYKASALSSRPLSPSLCGTDGPLAGGTKQGERTAECRRGLLCQDEEGREEDE